jgi:hypothetical protein
MSNRLLGDATEDRKPLSAWWCPQEGEIKRNSAPETQLTNGANASGGTSLWTALPSSSWGAAPSLIATR